MSKAKITKRAKAEAKRKTEAKFRQTVFTIKFPMALADMLHAEAIRVDPDYPIVAVVVRRLVREGFDRLPLNKEDAKDNAARVR